MSCFKQIFIAIIAIFTLFGCAKKFEAPKLESFVQKDFLVHYKNENARLIVSNDGKVYKFYITNTLGIPLAYKILENNEFKSLKFLPPNGAFDELFILVLDMIKDNKKYGVFTINDEIYKVNDVSI